MSAVATAHTCRSGVASTTASAPRSHALEGRVVLEMLLERFSQISLSGEQPRFRNSIVLRGLESLPVRCVKA